MKKEIYVLVDYLDRFETKVPSIPYRAGFNKNVLKNEFLSLGYSPKFVNFSEINFAKINFLNKYVIYTSIEDSSLFYKDFIEDILWGIKLQGGILIPRIELFRAHSNKVFMEILRTNLDNSIESRYYGTLKELLRDINKFKFPVVIKSAEGAGSRGVRLAKNKKQLIRYCKKLSNSGEWANFFKEKGLLLKRFLQTKHFFKTESIFRKKFIVQNFIDGLQFDYKVLIYDDKFYVLKRKNRKNDFRASGSGRFEFLGNINNDPPERILNFALNIYNKINVPNLSLDIAFNRNGVYLIEFQAISFGTLTQTGSEVYFSFKNNSWKKVKSRIPLEVVYARSIINYIKRNYEK